MINASLDAKNFKSFMRDLKQTTSKLQPAFRDSGEYLRRETLRQFDTETDPDGRPWEPLKPSTIARKKTNLKLRETLVMFNSLYYTATNQGLDFGIKDEKYIYHHYGTYKMPARVVIGITNIRRGKINEFVIAQIRRVKTKRSRSRKK